MPNSIYLKLPVSWISRTGSNAVTVLENVEGAAAGKLFIESANDNPFKFGMKENESFFYADANDAGDVSGYLYCEAETREGDVFIQGLKIGECNLAPNAHPRFRLLEGVRISFDPMPMLGAFASREEAQCDCASEMPIATVSLHCQTLVNNFLDDAEMNKLGAEDWKRILDCGLEDSKAQDYLESTRDDIMFLDVEKSDLLPESDSPRPS